MTDLILKFINEPGEYKGEHVAALRKSLAECGKVISAGLTIEQVLNTRVSLELIAAIQKFDTVSGELMKTTNRLSRWMLAFAIVAAGLGAAAIWITVLSYQLALAQVGK
jgi:hypothetical protein